MSGMRQQLRDNLVAITSLVVALSALGYNTWRNELTERNRNIRAAGIEMLQEIGSLQQIVFYAHFEEREDDQEFDPRGDPRMGWVDVFTINDLAAMMTAEAERDAARLRAVWEADSDKLIVDREAAATELAESRAAFQRIDGAIEELRRTALAALRALR
ncbi:MAG: hypothetical protein ACREST_08100 [Steroidobacteraceae bacterium]